MLHLHGTHALTFSQGVRFFIIKYQGDKIMNKTELIATVAGKTGMTKKDTEAAIKAILDIVGDSLKKGEKVQLIGFGSFEIHERAARTGKNPRTGESVTIPASSTPVFKAGKALKDAVNK